MYRKVREGGEIERADGRMLVALDAVVVEPRIPDHDVAIELLGAADGLLEQRGLDEVVGIEEVHIGAGRDVESLVARAAGPQMALGQDAHRGKVLVGAVALEHLEGVVRRPVVDADQLEVLERLRLEAVKRLAQVGLGVVHGHDDGNARRRHGYPQDIVNAGTPAMAS